MGVNLKTSLSCKQKRHVNYGKFSSNVSEIVTSAGQRKHGSSDDHLVHDWARDESTKTPVPVAGTNTRCCITRDRNLHKGYHDVIGVLTKLKASLSICSSTQKILFFFKLHGLLFLK